jgi:SAM-dependent methyltransferase
MNAVCLDCRSQLPVLHPTDSGEHVCSCGRTTPYARGIYQFVGKDEFYEGRFTGTCQNLRLVDRLTRLVRFVSIDGSEDRMWRTGMKHIKKHYPSGQRLEVLDIGAGGGHAFLTSLGPVTGIDVSFESLLKAQWIYDTCCQADARHLPFADESFDLVYSSHLLGHIPLRDKRTVVNEIYRVTRRGGFSLHSAECEADNVVYRKAKQHPSLYRKYFVDMYGHHGLEYPSLCMKRFRIAGFDPVYERPDYCKGLIRPANSYKVFFGETEFRNKEPLFGALALVSRVLSCCQATRLLADMVLYPISLINVLSGPDAVDSVKLLYRKPA